VGLQVEQIQRTVELLQTSKTGTLDAEEDTELFGQADDAMFGEKSGPIAKISTKISRAEDHLADVPRTQKAAKKFLALRNHTDDEQPALVTSVADVARSQKAARKFLALHNRTDESTPALETSVTDAQKADKKIPALRNKKDNQEASAEDTAD
jgi:hypothetical protein